MKTLLFMCVHNAGRSQMAAAFASSLGGDDVRVYSAGSEPADTVNPAVIEVMSEVGLDLSTQRPRLLSDDALTVADVVVSMGCGDACPILPGKRYVDWPLDDPSGQPVDVVRRIRDEIRLLVSGLLAELEVPSRP